MYRILIADSEMKARAGEVFTGVDAAFSYAENGSEVLDLSAEIEPDILIIDFSLPGLSGVETARVVHMSQPDLPIIMLTEGISPELREHVIQAGVSRILYKPVDKEEVRFFALKTLGASHERV